MGIMDIGSIKHHSREDRLQYWILNRSFTRCRFQTGYGITSPQVSEMFRFRELTFGGGGDRGKKGAHWYERDFSGNFCKFTGLVSVAGSPHCCRIKRRMAAGSLRGTVGISLKMVERQQDGE